MTVNRIIDAVRVRDQLGSPDAVSIFGPFKKAEVFEVRESPTVVFDYDTSAMAVWDDPDTTWDGTDKNDEWLDYEDASVKTVARIVNKDNTFLWDFRFEDTYDWDNKLLSVGLIGTDTTATVDIANQQVTFDDGDVLVIDSAFKDSSSTQKVIASTLEVTGTGVYLLELSADGGSNWEEVSDGVAHTFTNTGYQLMIRITGGTLGLTTSDGYEVITSDGFTFVVSDGTGNTITLIRCNYTIEE